MNDHLVRKVDVSEIRTAHEAATWHERLEHGLSGAEIRHYLHWLKASPANAEAFLFLDLLCNSLRKESGGNRYH